MEIKDTDEFRFTLSGLFTAFAMRCKKKNLKETVKEANALSKDLSKSIEDVLAIGILCGNANSMEKGLKEAQDKHKELEGGLQLLKDIGLLEQAAD